MSLLQTEEWLWQCSSAFLRQLVNVTHSRCSLADNIRRPIAADESVFVLSPDCVLLDLTARMNDHCRSLSRNCILASQFRRHVAAGHRASVRLVPLVDCCPY